MTSSRNNPSILVHKHVCLYTDGDITTGTSRPGKRPLAIDPHKVECLVHELKRFGMNAVARDY